MFHKIFSGCLKACLLLMPFSFVHADALTDFLQTHQASIQNQAQNDEDPLLHLIQNVDDVASDDVVFTPQENWTDWNFQSNMEDYLNVSASSAMIVDPKSNQVLYQKNAQTRRPIASISKLMSAMVVLDAKQNMNDVLTISEEDIDYLKNSSSRLTVGTQLTRREMLHIGLMASENRAIHALGRYYPGGMSAFLKAMNQKAKALGMQNTVFYDPTGLDPRNQATAQDLVQMVIAAHQYPLIRQYSTATSGSVFTASGRMENYRNSNALVRGGEWDIELQKTGYIREAGRCMVVYANIQKRPLIIVLMNSPSTTRRVSDAQNMRNWITNQSL